MFQFLVIICSVALTDHNQCKGAREYIEVSGVYPTIQACGIAAALHVDKLVQVPGWNRILLGSICTGITA